MGRFERSRTPVLHGVVMVRRCPRCSTPLRNDGHHLNGDDSPFCDINEVLRQIREQAALMRVRGRL